MFEWIETHPTGISGRICEDPVEPWKSIATAADAANRTRQQEGGCDLCDNR